MQKKNGKIAGRKVIAEAFKRSFPATHSFYTYIFGNTEPTKPKAKVIWAAAKRLENSKEIDNLIEDLLDQGVDPIEIQYIIFSAPVTFSEWEKVKKRSLKNIRKDHESVTKNLRDMANSLESYERIYGLGPKSSISILNAEALARSYGLIPGAKIAMETTKKLHPNSILKIALRQADPTLDPPTLIQYLRGYANLLEDKGHELVGDKRLISLHRDRKRKSNMENFFFRRIHRRFLDAIERSGMGRNYKSPNIETAIVAATLLDLKESPKSISNRVCHATS